jgi:hypothetical protein
MQGILGAGAATLFGMFVCAIPMIFGAWFAMRPTEKLLLLMRPLTLMGIFSGVCNFILALANTARAVGMVKGLDLGGIHRLGAGLSEGLAPVVVSFGCLTVAWACVAIGMRRR